MKIYKSHLKEVAKIKTCDQLWKDFIEHLQWGEKMKAHYAMYHCKWNGRSKMSYDSWTAAFKKRARELDPENDMHIY